MADHHTVRYVIKPCHKEKALGLSPHRAFHRQRIPCLLSESVYNVVVAVMTEVRNEKTKDSKKKSTAADSKEDIPWLQLATCAGQRQ